jgi:hypothetical protein
VQGEAKSKAQTLPQPTAIGFPPVSMLSHMQTACAHRVDLGCVRLYGEKLYLLARHFFHVFKKTLRQIGYTSGDGLMTSLAKRQLH